MPLETLYPRMPGLNQFAGNLNFDTRDPRKATPSFDHTILSTTDRLHIFPRAIEAQAPGNSHPRQYAPCNFTMWRLDDGTETADTTFNTGLSDCQIIDNGSGTPILFAVFGVSTNPYNAYRSLSTDTTPWTLNTAATSAAMLRVQQAGPDIYGVCDAGVVTLGEYHISKCPAGNQPWLAASWGNGLEVGSPQWGIFDIAAIGDSIVCSKPDGLYYYNDQTKRFENVLPFLADAPHAANGHGMRSVPNGVLYPTHDGHLWFFDGINVRDVSPDVGVPVRDAGYARISAIASNNSEVYAIRECFQNTTQGMGLKVITRIAGTYADVTTSVTNGSLSDGAAVATFGAAADDAIFVGADVPTEAINFIVTRNWNQAVQSFATPQYSNGTAGTVAPFDSSFTAFTAIRDGSILGTTGVSLNVTAFPPSASNSVVSWTDINAYDVMKSTSIAFGGAVGTLVKYWVRLKRTTATGMTASTTIDEVEIVPSRAGIPITAANDFTHRWRAGGLSEVLVGRWKGTSTIDWHSVYHVHTGGWVWAMAWHSGRVGTSGNGGQNLILWGRYSRVAIMESVLRVPSKTIAPKLVQYGTTKPGPLLDLAPGGTYLEGATEYQYDSAGSEGIRTRLIGKQDNRWRRKQVKGFYLMGDFMQSADTIDIYVQMDEEIDIIKAASVHGMPVYVPVDQSLTGYSMKAWLAYTDSVQTEVKAPELKAVIVDYEYIDEPLQSIHQRPDTAIPSNT